MIDPQDPIHARFELVAKEAQTLTFLPRATELQANAVGQVDEFLGELAMRKAECAQAGDEAAANALLAMELSLRAVREELRMWIALKEDAPEKAWDTLVSAEDLCSFAVSVRAQIGVETRGLENLAKKLLAIERLVFPPQVFCSVGGRVNYRECSICGEDYETCHHIKGRAYMGQQCHVKLSFGDLREVSLVSTPADKRCCLTHFSDQGKMRNRMTWRLEDSPPESSPTDQGV
jgi:hypothetical protein